MAKKTIWQLLAGTPLLYYTDGKWWTTEAEYNELKQLAKEEICRRGGITYEEGLLLSAEKHKVTALAEKLTKEQMEVDRLKTYIAKQEETIKLLSAELNEFQTKGCTSRRKDFNNEHWDWVTTNTGWLCVFRKKD